MVRRILFYLFLALILLLAIMLVNTLLTKSRQLPVNYVGPVSSDTAALARLAVTLRFQTISYDEKKNEKNKLAELEKMYSWMRHNYPLVHQNAEIKEIGSGSCIMVFEGTDKALKPAIFLAHLDVVPADTASSMWKFAPFSGTIFNDTLFGRGALDDKPVACAMLEAMETRIAKKMRTRRTIIFAFGHDEETGGEFGALEIAKYLQSKKITAEFICDEGFGVMEGLVPGVSKPVAIIGIAEKGYLSARISADISGGHSAMPKSDNATAILVRALSNIERSEARETFCEAQQQFFRNLAPEAAFGYRFLFSNLWITAPVVKSVLRKNNKAAATMRTTRAITIIKAGDKDNTLPSHAEAIINFRILPGETVASVMAELKRNIDDPRIKIVAEPDTINPSPTSSSSGFGWDCVNTTIRENFEDVIAVPSLVITGTDCKNYTSISKNIYRFVPLRLNNDNIGSIHGENEKLAAKNYYEMIRYYQLFFDKL